MAPGAGNGVGPDGNPQPTMQARASNLPPTPPARAQAEHSGCHHRRTMLETPRSARALAGVAFAGAWPPSMEGSYDRAEEQLADFGLRFPPTRGPRMPTSCASSSRTRLGDPRGAEQRAHAYLASSSPWTASRRGGSFPSTGSGKRRRSLVSPFERGSVRPSFRRVLSGFVGTLVFSTNSDADGIPFGAFDVPTVFFISKSDDSQPRRLRHAAGPALRPRDGRTGVSVLREFERSPPVRPIRWACSSGWPTASPNNGSSVARRSVAPPSSRSSKSGDPFRSRRTRT